ncbi:MAG: hypothetical protein LKM41_10655 [Lachnospiraceae bacterium]|jgi:hypothetical protein|nr:hypothetical protein [Lachnospiraceae bacterium]
MGKQKIENTLDVTEENLRREIQQYHRDQVLMLLKKNVLGQVAEDDKSEIYRSIISLRNFPMVDYVVKDAGHLKSECLKLDFDITQNRVFISEILKKYRKSLDLSTKEERESFFEMACEINDDDTVKYMIRHDIDIPDYTDVSCLATDAFRTVSSACKSKISAKEPAAFYEAVSKSKDAVEKMKILLEDGYDLSVKNEKQETVLDCINKRLKANKYKSNKDGNAARTSDRRILRLLNPEPADEEETGKARKKKYIVYGIIGAAVLACCIAAFILNRANLSSSADDSTVSEATTSAAESGSSESAAADSESASVSSESASASSDSSSAASESASVSSDSSAASS